MNRDRKIENKPLSNIDERHDSLLSKSMFESDRKFWSGERPISVVQGVGLLVMFFALIGGLGVVTWPKGEAPWWQKIGQIYT